jgi:hypothetical protein
MTWQRQLSPLNLALTLFVIVSVCTVVVMAVAKWIGRWARIDPGPRADYEPPPDDQPTPPVMP